ncbi:MAG TPA: hypothetical protein VE861_12955 [Gemmatimonadaceae bacterium]|nr:hypothetical protein [Gemmatimonadaceae bacterium]
MSLSLPVDLTVLLHAAPMRMVLLLAASAWTAATCHRLTRHFGEARTLFGSPPRRSTLALCAAGVLVWGANGIEQPMLAANVAAFSIALMFGWELGGVLERAIEERR